MARFFDVTLRFRVGGQMMQPIIRHIPALDAADAQRKALDTPMVKVARMHGEKVQVMNTEASHDE